MNSLSTWLRDWDQQWFYFCNRACRVRIFDLSMPWITELGGPFFSVLSCLLLYFWGTPDLRITAWDGLLALVFSHLAAQIIKWAFTRPRPYMTLPDVYTVFPLKDPSFPSGHTTAAFSLAVCYALHFPFFAGPLLTVAAVVGFSRIYLGLHYPSDVGIGALLGSSAATLTFMM